MTLVLALSIITPSAFAKGNPNISGAGDIGTDNYIDPSGNYVFYGFSKNEFPISPNTYVGYGYLTSGYEVMVLQVCLKTYANRVPASQKYLYDPGAIDSQFGAATRQALINVQSAVGLSADGIAGPNTWYKVYYNVFPDGIDDRLS